MVEDCVFAQSSGFQFGVRSKTKLTLVQLVHSFGERTRYNPGSAGSEFAERPGSFSKL